jgi:hypothetical protein
MENTMKTVNLKTALGPALMAACLFVSTTHAGSWSNPLTLAGVTTDSDGGLRYAEVTSNGPCSADAKTLWMSPSISVEGKKTILAALLTALSTGMNIRYYGDCDASGYNRITYVRVGN